MPDIQTLSEPILPNLKQLPKDKIVLEYILRNLSENSSLEKFELISSIFEMYRTCAGFDPIALSKGRFKRVKASEFKRMVKEIDHELGAILKSDEYSQLKAKQINDTVLFNQYLSLSEDVNKHPYASMQQEVEEFEERLKKQESQELLLNFYRNHHKFYEETYAIQHLDSLLKKYDGIQEKANQHARKVRCGFILTWLEQEFLKGKVEHIRIKEVWDELANLLISESNKFSRNELLIQIIRCGLLTSAPAQSLDQYLIYCAENIAQIIQYNPESAILIYGALSHYHPTANANIRDEWIQKADAIAKEEGVDDSRGYFRLIRALNAADDLNPAQVIRYLNEAEHQVHKAQGRSLLTKNTWILICEYRIMMYTYFHIQNSNDYPPTEFDIHIRIAEELGKHRHDNAILSQELRGYKNFIAKDWISSLACFEKALEYRKTEPENDRFYMDHFFTILLKNKLQKKETILKDSMDKIKTLGSPFFKSLAIELCNKAIIYFEESSKNKIAVGE